MPDPRQLAVEALENAGMDADKAQRAVDVQVAAGVVFAAAVADRIPPDTLLAYVVGAHRLTTPVQCACGWRETDSDSDSWADHTAAALLPIIAAHVAEQERAAAEKAWDEGHQVGWEHCRDGNYGNDYWDDETPNPYRKAGE